MSDKEPDILDAVNPKPQPGESVAETRKRIHDETRAIMQENNPAHAQPNAQVARPQAKPSLVSRLLGRP